MTTKDSDFTVTSMPDIKDEVIEKNLIEGFFEDGSVSKAVSILPGEENAFTDPRFAAIWIGMYEMFRKAEFVEPASLSTVLLRNDLLEQAGGIEHLQELADNKHRVNIKVLSQELLDMFTRRKLLDLADQLSETAYDHKKDMAARAEFLNEQYQHLQGYHVRDTGVIGRQNLTDYYFNLLDKRERERKEGVQYLRFPNDELHALVGNLQGGWMIGLTGNPGAGKTSFMQQIGELWSFMGFNGIFYHLETSLEVMMDRTMARRTGIPTAYLRGSRAEQETVLNSLEYENIFAELELLGKRQGDLRYVFCPGWSMPQITADIQRQAELDDIDFVMVDYMNKVRIVQKLRSSYVTFDIGQMLEEYKITLEKLGLVGFMAAQMAKGRGKNKAPTLDDVRDTAELADKSQVGLVIVREQEDKSGELSEYADVRVTKANDGKTGKVGMYYEGERYRFESY